MGLPQLLLRFTVLFSLCCKFCAVLFLFFCQLCPLFGYLFAVKLSIVCVDLPVQEIQAERAAAAAHKWDGGLNDR